MTGVMKASDEARQSEVRLFKRQAVVSGRQLDSSWIESQIGIENSAAPTQSPRQEDPSDYYRKQVGRLETELEHLRVQLDQASDHIENREERAYDRGREAGRLEAQEESEKRLGLLAESLAEARETFVGRQSEIEVLALGISNTIIGKVLGDDPERATLIGDAIAVQSNKLRDELTLSVQVSAVDFPGDAELSALRERFPELDIVAATSLAGGECRMGLRLGQLDLGLPGQWLKIQELFATMAQDREPNA